MKSTQDTFWIKPKPLSRRTAFKGLGVSLALPMLDAMASTSPKVRPVEQPRRMVNILVDQGIVPWHFFPKEEGLNYTNTKYLEILKEHKKEMTVFSGTSLPDVTGGHHADVAFLTGAAHPSRGGFKNSVSIDQVAAEYIGHKTRFPSLSLRSRRAESISCTRAGVLLPGEEKPEKLFQKMFIKGKPSDIAAQKARLQEGRSILDTLLSQSKAFSKKVGKHDQHKIDAFQNSVREAEIRLEKMQAWQSIPKPQVSAKTPKKSHGEKDVLKLSPMLLDLTKLALETDSTRLVTLIFGGNQWHPVTHHGKRQEKLSELESYESKQFKILNNFVNSLKSVNEGQENLLDRTIVHYGTNMGDANRHSNDNLPTLVLGGGFKHKGHLAFDKKNNYPLTNLYLSMLHRLGVEVESFSSSTGTMRGLELT
ncbi:MAG: DUF1552 domain-containing protein [Lentisphaeraceae bacterium]|nr:DUF1552 domain-containing protein [Lentisphaeraceae bacterium]